MLSGESRFDVSQSRSFTYTLRVPGAKTIAIEFGYDGNAKCSGSVAVYLGTGVSGAPPWRTIDAETLRVYPSPEADVITLVPSAGALGICTVMLSQDVLGIGIFPFDPSGGGGGGGGGGGAIAVAAGTPQGSGTLGAIAASTDGAPGATLFAYACSGVFPIPINFGVLSLGLAAAGVATVPMLRGTQDGSLLVAFLTQTSTIQAALQTGWSWIYNNSGPTPAIAAAWAWAAGTIADAQPFNLTSTEGGCLTVFEIANANTATPIASFTDGSTGADLAMTSGQLVLACISSLYPSPLAPRGYYCAPLVTPHGSYYGQQVLAVPFVAPLVASGASTFPTLGGASGNAPGLVAIAAGAKTVNYWAPIG